MNVKKICQQNFETRGGIYNLPKTWQALRSLATTEHAQGKVWRKMEGSLEEGSSFWLRRLGRSKIEQNASTFMVGW